MESELLLPIAHLNDEGEGIAHWTRHDDKRVQVIVPYALPGETVSTLLLKRRRQRYLSQLQAIPAPSSDRVIPRCVHFQQCGGCRLQHLSYDAQLQWKSDRVLSLFSELLADCRVLPALPAPSQWRYRNKMEYTFQGAGAYPYSLGLYSRRGRVTDLHACHLVPEWFNEALALTRSWWQTTPLQGYHPPKNSGELRNLTLRASRFEEQKMAFLTVTGDSQLSPESPAIVAWQHSLQEAFPEISLHLRVHHVLPKQPTLFSQYHLAGSAQIEELLRLPGKAPVRFAISPTSFFQPNPQQAETLFHAALAIADVTSNATLYDLYCGAGTFGLLAAKQAQKVIAIELNPEAIEDARAAACNNGITNISFHQGDVGEILARFGPDPTAIACIDPPRAGLNESALQNLLTLNPKKIIYISCNPTTQHRDSVLLHARGYRLGVMQTIDQFPHTLHVENIVLLERV